MTLTKSCTIPNCEGRVKAWGWCDNHYRRWRLYADPEGRAWPIRFCKAAGCKRRVHARGKCTTHYWQWWAKPRLRPAKMPERVLDLLDLDGGWLTGPGVALALKASESHVNRTLYRLQNQGLVQQRRVVLREWHYQTRTSNSKGSQEVRLEWKTL